MPTIGITVEGVGDLQALLMGLDEDVRGDVVQDGLVRGAEIVAADAAARAPRITGALAASIHAQKRDVEPGESVAAGVVGAWYWRFPEFGVVPHELGRKRGNAFHPGQPAHPFIRPALDENEERVVTEVADAIRGALEARAR
jgi:HK97 gp10 family phage protein